MRLSDGRYECDVCGEVLCIPHDAETDLVVRAVSGKIRSLYLSGQEIHRCEIGNSLYDKAHETDYDAFYTLWRRPTVAHR